MDKVDKLIIKAKRAAQRKAERFHMGFITHDPDTGKWTAHGQLCGGKTENVRQTFTEHETMKAAEAALRSLADEYPNTVEDTVIFIDDIAV